MNRRFARAAEVARTSAATAVTLLLLLALPNIGCTLFRRDRPVGPATGEPADSTSEETSESPGSEASYAEPMLEEELEAEGLLALGDAELADGDPDGAAETYMRVVEEYPRSDEAARALFQLATLQLDPSAPIYDHPEGIASLERIELEHPDSPWAPAAALVLELTRQRADLERTLEALRSQLDELKKLDLAADPSDG